MSPVVLLSFIIGYFLMLIVVSYLTSRKSSDNATFFIANRSSRWYLVAFGMIGTALSGVTFISVPGEVGNLAGSQFRYFQFVLGNAVGYFVVAGILLPLYYKMHLISIYEVIERTLGKVSHKTAAAIFLISRTIGSAFRLYLVAIVLQRFIFDEMGVPFWLTIVICLLLIWGYTFRGGLKTIIITDSLQTFFLVTSVFLSIYFICNSLHLNIGEAFKTVKESNYSKIFFTEHFSTNKFHFTKQFLGGIFVTIGMFGLDQDLMQKNLSCKNLKESQKNMLTFTFVFVLINLFFLSVGALLYIYAKKMGIAIPLDTVTHQPRTDYLFPEIALNHFKGVPAVVFMLGLTAATFATTDSGLTALTTSFCIDFLNFDKNKNQSEKQMVRKRTYVHVFFSILILLVILLFNAVNDASVVSAIFKVATYTYGPLIGLFAFSLYAKKRNVLDKATPVICILAPLACFFIDKYSTVLFNGYVFAEELIIVNGLLTFLGLLLISKKKAL
ncbi:sodium:solute symporter [Ginsengibacter hankyongi]|uniref:Sodium:solute symporter n=1 Tax=Ginsengibacter hankyongi TaxID=2607284 RepID=A0A5J5IKH5_9BACT|nr:sodium:solute symporter [Ginsengibacter hankyongi]KAA9041520.1 sodium:solute symporter [Ginsengibacter hankyongi]